MVSSDNGKNSPVSSSVLPAEIKPLVRRVSTTSAMEYRRLPFLRVASRRVADIIAASSRLSALRPASMRFLRLSVTDTSFSLRSSVARERPSSAQAASYTAPRFPCPASRAARATETSRSVRAALIGYASCRLISGSGSVSQDGAALPVGVSGRSKVERRLRAAYSSSQTSPAIKSFGVSI